MSERRLRIGVFDSGIGGFSILKEVVRLLPHAQLFYIADDAFGTYGTKQIDIIGGRVVLMTEMLVEKSVDLVIVACNTATAAGIDYLRERFKIPFVGVEPYINIVHKEQAMLGEVSRVGVITTELTGKSKRFVDLKQRLDPSNSIHHHICLRLASIIEDIYKSGLEEGRLKEIRKELAPLKGMGLTHLILGCTHYSLISKQIEKILEIQTISPASAVAEQARRLVENIQVDCSIATEYQFLSTLKGEWNAIPIATLNRWPI
jgi:glutamate racemase